MTNRHQLNEAASPVPITVLARLLRVGDEQARETILSLPERQRAELAVFCYRRAHMRDLALTVAALCDETDLVRTAGTAGVVIAEQARQPRPHAKITSEPFKRTVTLAQRA